jgi:flagellar hook-length control protein FliK
MQLTPADTSLLAQPAGPAAAPRKGSGSGQDFAQALGAAQHASGKNWPAVMANKAAQERPEPRPADAQGATANPPRPADTQRQRQETQLQRQETQLQRQQTQLQQQEHQQQAMQRQRQPDAPSGNPAPPTRDGLSRSTQHTETAQNPQPSTPEAPLDTPLETSENGSTTGPAASSATSETTAQPMDEASALAGVDPAFALPFEPQAVPAIWAVVADVSLQPGPEAAESAASNVAISALAESDLQPLAVAEKALALAALPEITEQPVALAGLADGAGLSPSRLALWPGALQAASLSAAVAAPSALGLGQEQSDLLQWIEQADALLPQPQLTPGTASQQAAAAAGSLGDKSLFAGAFSRDLLGLAGSTPAPLAESRALQESAGGALASDTLAPSALAADGLAAGKQQPGAGFAALSAQAADKTGLSLQMQFSQQHLASQLSERTGWMVQHKLDTAEIQLDPPELGPITVKVQMQQDQLAVTFVSANPQVRDALEQSQQRLRDLLAEQGLTLSHSGVSDQERSQQDSRNSEATPGLGDEGAAAEEPPTISWVASPHQVDHFV